MAEESGRKASGPRMDDFVRRVVPDPNNPPNALLLSGYLGESSEEGHTRLYFDTSLSTYVEIPNDAILHTEPIPESSSSLGGSYIWINRDAEVVHGQVGTQRPRSRFFQGPIMQDFGSGQGAQGVGPMQPGMGQAQAFTQLTQCQPQPLTQIVQCQPSVLTLCPSQTVICQSLSCPSQTVICQSLDCPSQTFFCQSQICPSQAVICQSLDCPSQAFFCQSQVCPSRTFICDSQICPSRVGCPSDFCGPIGRFGGDPRMQQGMAQAQGFGPMRQGPEPARAIDQSILPCPSQNFSCPSQITLCIPSQNTFCVPSQNTPCPPSQNTICPPSVNTICPPPSDFCPPSVNTICPPSVNTVCPPPSQNFPCQSQNTVCPPPSQNFPCPSQNTICPTQNFPCPSQNVPCPTQNFPCPSQNTICPPSLNAPCPTQNLPCPSVNTFCPPSQNTFCPPSQNGPCLSQIAICNSQFGCRSEFCGGGGFTPR